MYAVEVKNVTKTYGSRTLFNQIRLSVNEGELVAVTVDFNACIIKKKPTHLSFCFNVVQHFLKENLNWLFSVLS